MKFFIPPTVSFRKNHLALGLALAAIFLGACRPADKEAAKPISPAKVSQIAKEESLSSIVLTPEAEKRLGLVTSPVISKKMPRFRTFAGELLLALGKPLPSAQAASGAAETVSKSIYSLLPAMTPTEMIRLAETQIDADGQINAAEVQLEAARVVLSRTEKLLAEKVTSARALDEAKAQVKLAETSLQTARARRELLGTPLFEAVRQDVLWLRVSVYVGEVADLKSSEPARIGDLGSRTNSFLRSARPVSIPITSSAGLASVDLYYEVDNKNGGLRPGQRVAVQIPVQGELESLVVPASALIYDIYGGSWVYENTAPHGFTRRRVEVRFVMEGQAAIARGLKEGTQVVITGVAELFGTEFGFGK